MGLCDSSQKPSRYLNMPNIYHQQLDQIPPNSAYMFDFSIMKKNFNKNYNLKFTFFDFKVKYCVSHKPDKTSFYITEIKIGDKSFPLSINSGQSPNIQNIDNNGYFIEKQFTFQELENTFLSLDIYEITENLPSINMSMKTIPPQIKQQAMYHSFFRINLSSFLFKSIKCDFPLMGDQQQLSSNARITFNCILEHREKIKIDAGPKNNPNIQRLIFEYKDQVLSCQTRQANNLFSLITPPLTMSEFQSANLFMETIENDNYSYISLNEHKDKIIRKLTKDMSLLSDLSLIQKHYPVNTNINTPINNSIFSTNFQVPNLNNGNYNTNELTQSQIKMKQIVFKDVENFDTQDATLYLSNLPILAQLHNVYFTEFGNTYNTSALNIINEDKNLYEFRKGKQISSDDFREKLTKYYGELCKPNFNFGLLNEIQILLLRSIDTDRFMFIYPTYDSLYAMITLMMKLGITTITYLFSERDETKIVGFSKIINTLMKREELDNGVIYNCFSNFQNFADSSKELYSQFYFYLFQLYIFLINNKVPTENEDIIIEIISKLYFRKRYLRKVMLSTLSGINYEFKVFFTGDNLIYDEINDDKLNAYLKNDTIEKIEDFCKNKDILNKISFDKYKLFKRIVAFLKDAGAWEYPLDFILFHDNVYILEAIIEEFKIRRLDSNNKQPLNNNFYETIMLFSNSYAAITNVNNNLIQNINAHNQYAICALFIYLKSLLDYHYSLTNTKLIFDYTSLEKASDILIKDADSVSLPRLFWFYYSCYNLVLPGNLKWFIIHMINKNFKKFAYHWSFTIRQVYFKLILFVLVDRIKNAEGKFFNKQYIDPFIKRNLNVNSNPYILQASKDFETIRKEYKMWADRAGRDPKAELPTFNLPLPIMINGNIDNF